MVSSWEDSRTKVERWRRWEGYKPRSPWVMAQRTFPASDRWGGSLEAGKANWEVTLDPRYRVKSTVM